jgi:hypothetical protein
MPKVRNDTYGRGDRNPETSGRRQASGGACYAVIAIMTVSCVVQVIWIIPEELTKRVSQAQFLLTLRLEVGVVNYNIFKRQDRSYRSDASLVRR